MAFFAQKTSCLGEFLVDFFLMERGGYSTLPLTDGPLPKKLTERGGTPLPPSRTISGTRIIEPFPKRFEHFEHFDN